jgi:hypothetical protein
MAGSLIKVDEFTISSAVASIILGGGSSGSSGANVSIDSTYDVYLFTTTNSDVSVDNSNILLRVTKTSDNSADTTANYDNAYKLLSPSFDFSNQANTNMTSFQHLGGSGTGTNESGVATAYLFNWANTNEYSFMTWETNIYNQTPALFSAKGGQVHTVAQSNNGIQILMNTGNLTSGTFTIYGLRKF